MEARHDKVIDKPILSISVPPSQRTAFYQALIRLRQAENATFMSASALIVKTVIAAAAELDQPEAAHE